MRLIVLGDTPACSAILRIVTPARLSTWISWRFMAPYILLSRRVTTLVVASRMSLMHAEPEAVTERPKAATTEHLKTGHVG